MKWLRALLILLVAETALGQGTLPPIYYLKDLLDCSITSPTNTQVLTYDSATGKWKNATSLAGAPGGADQQLQYNNAGAFGGIPYATFNGTALTLVGGIGPSGRLYFADSLDATKRTRFDLSSITPAANRTLTLPNYDSSTVPGGGTTGQVLKKNTNTDYDYSWGTSSAAPGGANTQVQYNDVGVFGGDPAFTFNDTLGQVTVTNYPIVNLTDAITTSSATGLKLLHSTTGTAAANFGQNITFQLEDAGGGSTVQAGVETVAWSSATTPVPTAYFDWGLTLGGSFLPGKMRLHGSGGLSVNNTTDPGAGIISANTGYWVGTAASTSGKILKSNGSAFIASTETYAAPGTSGNVLTSDGTNWTSAAPGGGGGVTSFASGNLSPLFTVTPSSATTGAISQAFTLSTAAANTVFGNATGSTAAPSYGAVVTGQITNSAVTLAKIQNATANSKLLGSGAAGSGAAYSELSLGTNLSITGTTLNASGGGTPGGSTTQLQYNNAGAFGGISSFTFDGTIPGTVTLTPAANTYATGFLLTDTTVAASSGNQQYSPSLIFHGSGWKTAATAGPQNVDIRMAQVPVQNTSNPTTKLEIAGSINNAAYGAIANFIRDQNNAAQLQMGGGNGIAGPEYSFSAETNTGMYRVGAGEIGFSGAGTQSADITTSQLWTLGVHALGGTTGAPTVVLRPSAGLSVTQSTAANYQPVVAGNTSSSNTTQTGFTLNIDNTIGAGGTGLGVGMKFQAETDTTNDTEIGQILGVWGTGTHASRTGYLDFQLVNNAAADASKMRLFGSGGLAVNNTTDPGAGVIAANTGYRIGTASSTSGKILKSDGTNFVASTETYAAPGTSGNVMKSDGTNWTSGTVTAAPGGADTQIQFNDAGALNGNTNFTITKSTNTMTAWGMKFVLGPTSAGGWIDMPTTGPSGIGTGGAGSNPWVAYVSSSGQWFNGTAAGDLAYRNSSSQKTFFGTGSTNATFSLGASQTMPFASGSIFGFSSAGDSAGAIDTGFARNAAGIFEINNGTAGTYRQLKLANATIVPTATMAGNVVSAQTANTSTTDQTATTETAHVTYTVPANLCNVGTTFRIEAWGDMDNGTTAITFTPRIRWGGTAGTQLLATPTVVSTTTALTGKTWNMEAMVTIRTTGATGTAVAQMTMSNHTASSAGAYGQDDANTGGTAVTIDTASNKDLVLTWTLSATTGTPHVRTYGGVIELVKQ